MAVKPTPDKLGPSPAGGREAAVSRKFTSPDSNETRPVSGDPYFDYLVMLLRNDRAKNEGAENAARREDLNRLIDDHFGVKSYDELMAKGTLTQRDILSAEASDTRIATMRVGVVTNYETGQRQYLVGRRLDDYLVNQGIGRPPSGREHPVVTQGDIKVPHSPARSFDFKLTTIGESQRDLVSAIDRAAKITGVPAPLLGAMAGIESKFGRDLVSPTGAVGTFQQTGGYRAERWKLYGEDIARYVPEAREAMKGGLTKEEMKQLAFNDDAAALMTAYSAKAFARKYNLDLNDPKTWGLVYAEHNAGEGSVKRLLSGGMTEKWIMDANPAIYRNVGDSKSALLTYQTKMEDWAKNYEKLETRIARDSSQRDPVLAATRTGPEPRPT